MDRAAVDRCRDGRLRQPWARLKYIPGMSYPRGGAGGRWVRGPRGKCPGSTHHLDAMAQGTAVNTPERPPEAGNVAQWRDFALMYLRSQLGNRAPCALCDHTLFESTPLEGEGPVVLFPFEAD